LWCTGTESCNESDDICEHTGNPCDAPELCDDINNQCELVCTGCAISNVCYGEDQINPLNDCQVCNSNLNASDWTNVDNGTVCDDGIFCNGVDSCTTGVCTPPVEEACSSTEECNEANDICEALVWLDVTTNLMWKKGNHGDVDWQGAQNYCNTLDYAGFTDWRVPTISEMRTVIINCDATTIGGDCLVTDDCNNETATCYDYNVCKSCSTLGTAYIVEEIENKEILLWSSTEVATSGESIKGWNVYARYGSIFTRAKTDTMDTLCVR